MKVEVTVTAEFPLDIPYDVIERLAWENGDSEVLRNAAVTHIEMASSGGTSPRRSIEWHIDCVDIEDTTSDAVFQAQLLAAAKRGIKLELRVRKLDPEGVPGEELEKTVSWNGAKIPDAQSV